MPRSRQHVTATDRAGAEMIVDVIEALRDSGDTAQVARNTLAQFLADKREEWLSCAMVRFEREFRVTRRKRATDMASQERETK